MIDRLRLIVLMSLSAASASAQGLNGVLDVVQKPTREGQAGIIFNIANPGTKVPTELGYGLRTIYTNPAAGKTTYDIGAAFHSAWQQAPSVPGGQVFGTWVIAEGPMNAQSNYGVVGTEINIVNRGDDTGWTPFRGTLPRFSAVLQLVPESNTFTHGGTAQNITAGVAIGHSPGPRADGAYVKTYSAFLIEPNAIAGGGRALTFTGDNTSAIDTPAITPYGIATILGNWSHGIDTTGAVIFDSTVLKMTTKQKIGWFTADGVAGASVGSNDSGDLNLSVPVNGALNIIWGGISRRVAVGAPNSAGPGSRLLTVVN